MTDRFNPVFGLEEVEPYWPARLLHVRSMTSFSREKLSNGNVSYNGRPNPPYNILSYTWGRYRVKQKHEPGSALKVGGINWEIPKIRHPAQGGFMSEDFKKVIDVVCGDIEFVWVDVACIPQQNYGIRLSEQDEGIANREIGSQAGIFKGAQSAYIWLATLSTSDFQHAIRRFHEGDLKLLEDNWFSSLWTLQEASLRKDATLLSSKGDSAQYKHEPMKLLDILRMFTQYLRRTNLQRINARLSGLEALVGRNPVPLLGIARHRVVGRKEDHVYGIMQVFDIKVGKTVGEDIDDLPELLLAFFQVMNQKSPVVAQAFRHRVIMNDDDPLWAPKIGSFSVGQGVPGMKGGSMQYDDTQIVPLDFYDIVEVPDDNRADLSTYRGNISVLTFRGYAFDLEHLQHSLKKSNPRQKNTTSCSVWMDAEFTPSNSAGNVFVVGKRDPKNEDVPSPMEVVKGLIQKTQKDRVVREVLYMGKFEFYGEDDKMEEGYLGIIISRDPESKYDCLREGFCTWSRYNEDLFQRHCKRVLV